VIGGVATTICADGEYVKSDGAQVGDVVVLTKPLGTQVAVNVHEWRVRKTPKWAEITKRKILSDEEAEDMMHAAVCSMSRLNRHGGAMMLKHRAHAGTDVTGFGILGHAQNLMDNQQEAVGMEIHTLPCIANTAKIEESGVFDFRLLKGYSAETSGGLMICMKEEDAVEYIKELEDLDGEPAWIIGRIIESAERKATILDEVKVLEISCCDSC
jgi:selenide,water dikinase